MALKELDQLITEIDTAVHSNGPAGKTTAASLSTVLKSLATELTTQQQESASAISHKADLDAGGRVPSDQLPSYVDDIVEVADFAALPESGEAGKVYITLDTNKQYRWAGSIYALLSDSGLMAATKDALEASHNASASNAFVTQAEVALNSNRYADIVSANRTRAYYDSADAAFNASVSGDTVNLYSPLNLQVPPTSEAVLDLHPGVSANIYGITLTSPDANHDIITFRGGGRQVLNGFNSVVTQLPGSQGGWYLGSYDVVLDAYIYDLHFNIPNYNSVGFAVFGSGTMRYRGNIVGANRYIGQFTPQNGKALAFYGEGRMEQSVDYLLWVREGAHVEWRGDSIATNNARYQLDKGTLVLREGTFTGNVRPAGSEVLVANGAVGDTTLILENYFVNGVPGTTVVQADTVILRGNTVVVGNIQATTLVDERPAPTLVPAIKTEPVVGDNLLDLADPDILLDYYINENYIGDTTNLSGWTASGFIPVTANKSYSANNNITHSAWFDADKQFIANYNSTSGVAPTSAAYLRVSVQSPGFSSLMVVLGASSDVPAAYKKFWRLLLTSTAKPFADKKIGLVGDSLTLQGFYIDSLISELGAGSYVKEGFSGQVFRSGIDMLPANAFAGCALIQVMFGTNEYGHGGNTLGTTSDSSAANTICGVVRYAYEVLHAQYPTATIYFVTPTERGAFAGEPTSPTPNPYGLTIKLIGDAIKAVCRSLDIPFVDLYDSSNINSLTFAQTLQSDELHWSSNGAAYVGKVIGQAINKSSL